MHLLRVARLQNETAPEKLPWIFQVSRTNYKSVSCGLGAVSSSPSGVLCLAAALPSDLQRDRCNYLSLHLHLSILPELIQY